MTFIRLLLFFCVAALFLAALLWASVSDLKTRTIPNLVSLLLLAAGVLNLFTDGFSSQRLLSAFAGAAIGFIPLFVMALLKGTIGGGDVKLAASAGFALGWLPSYLTLMTALLMFVLFGCCTMPKKQDKEAPGLPFAPFYAAAALGAFVLPAFLSLHIPIHFMYL